MELVGEAPVEGRWVDRIVGLDDVRVDIAAIGSVTSAARVCSHPNRNKTETVVEGGPGGSKDHGAGGGVRALAAGTD
jgi:hypothetical protein